MTAPPRLARLVLVTSAGEVLGALPPCPVATPWWQDVGPIVQAARELHGVHVTILRMLAAERPHPHGGTVTYLAEADAPPPGVVPWPGALDEHPLRQPWARPGGPGDDLAWVDSVLRDRGQERTAPAEQIRSWNLSSLWRIPARGQTLWLKHVPPFFGHEGALIARLAGGPVPALVGHDGRRILMPEIPGEDLYEAGVPILERLVSLLVGLQHDMSRRVDDLVALGLPDWRAPVLSALIADVLDRTPGLSDVDRATLAGFVDRLPERFRRIADAGLPDTLVHGDFHPGNARGDAATAVLLDWGDSGVGHPLLDQPAFLAAIPPGAAGPVRRAWSRAWHAAIPGCDPERAAELLAPVAAARQAIIYRKFLDSIEPSEHPYHARDPALWLAQAADLARSRPSG
ncbi:aminoglycoside phosphotransferase family protein [Sorangium sp. So ce1335]|uniref:aminoglycoside phosphotransferase family protein n=1 Tax=Sorangium sp. So ce1335 TaxID=3133335 RepID=UPI003F5DEF28